MPRRLQPDMWLFGAAVVLLSAGVVMVYSASAIVAAERFQDPYFFLKRQLFWAVLGGGVLWVALRVDYRLLEKAVLPVLILAGVLLVLVLVPPFGQAINGTRRWIRLGLLSFQPAELAKLALVVYLAAFLARRRGDLTEFRTGTLPALAVAGLLAGLVLVQPDLGNCMTLIVVTFGLLYLAGSPARHLAWVAARPRGAAQLPAEGAQLRGLRAPARGALGLHADGADALVRPRLHRRARGGRSAGHVRRHRAHRGRAAQVRRVRGARRPTDDRGAAPGGRA